MKKKILSWAAASMLLCACTNPANFSGQIDGLDNDTLLLMVSNAEEGNWIKFDTVPLNKGKFETQIPDSMLTEVYITKMRKAGEKGPQILGSSFLLFPGDQMRVSGKLPYGLIAEGTELYDALKQNEDWLKTTQALADLNLKMDEVDDNNDPALADSLNLLYDELERKMKKISMEMIQAHPDHLSSGFLSLDLDAREGLEAIQSLSENVKQSLLKNLILTAEKDYQRTIEVEEAEKRIQPGVQIPAFSLKSLEGKMMTPADFKGKYAVLDFWGTWCGWCLAGIPQMKTYYEKYHKQVEFVGICCSDKEERWKTCVNKKQMKWTQLFSDETTDLAKTYGVSGFPTKMIVDPSGKIVEIFVGESEEFYDKLDELFRKK